MTTTATQEHPAQYVFEQVAIAAELVRRAVGEGPGNIHRIDYAQSIARLTADQMVTLVDMADDVREDYDEAHDIFRARGLLAGIKERPEDNQFHDMASIGERTQRGGWLRPAWMGCAVWGCKRQWVYPICVREAGKTRKRDRLNPEAKRGRPS